MSLSGRDKKRLQAAINIQAENTLTLKITIWNTAAVLQNRKSIHGNAQTERHCLMIIITIEVRLTVVYIPDYLSALFRTLLRFFWTQAIQV